MAAKRAIGQTFQTSRNQDGLETTINVKSKKILEVGPAKFRQKSLKTSNSSKSSAKGGQAMTIADEEKE